MERGSAVAAKWSPLLEDNWDLRWPKSVKMYSKMAREDAQVKSVLKAVSLPILRTPCRISPNGADEAFLDRLPTASLPELSVRLADEDPDVLRTIVDRLSSRQPWWHCGHSSW